MNSKNDTSGTLTIGLSVLVLMAMALVASEIRSPSSLEGVHTVSPDRILLLEAGKG